jgi:hypothetical protein
VGLADLLVRSDTGIAGAKAEGVLLLIKLEMKVTRGCCKLNRGESAAAAAERLPRERMMIREF